MTEFPLSCYIYYSPQSPFSLSSPETQPICISSMQMTLVQYYTYPRLRISLLREGCVKVVAWEYRDKGVQRKNRQQLFPLTGLNLTRLSLPFPHKTFSFLPPILFLLSTFFHIIKLTSFHLHLFLNIISALIMKSYV